MVQVGVVRTSGTVAVGVVVGGAGPVVRHAIRDCFPGWGRLAGWAVAGGVCCDAVAGWA